MSKVATDYHSLGVSERIELVAEIWDSIADEALAAEFLPTPEQRKELHRRLAAHRADPSSSIPWHEARKSLFKAGS